MTLDRIDLAGGLWLALLLLLVTTILYVRRVGRQLAAANRRQGEVGAADRGDEAASSRPPVPGTDSVLWAVRWRAGGVTVFTAGDPWEHIRRRVGSLADGWPRRRDADVAALAPVVDLRFGILSRQVHNAPGPGRLVTEGYTATWRGPGVPSCRVEGTLVGVTEGDPLRGMPASAFARGVWAWVRDGISLELIPAVDAAEARSRFASEGHRGVVQDDLERMQAFECHFIERWDGLPPRCYRLWIAGEKVGWPDPRRRIPSPRQPPPGGSGPDVIFARAPIPRYDRTVADGELWRRVRTGA